MKKTKNIHNPHMIIAESAHAAYWKASEYFCIQLSVVPVDSQFLLHPSDVKKHLRSNTILVIYNWFSINFPSLPSQSRSIAHLNDLKLSRFADGVVYSSWY